MDSSSTSGYLDTPPPCVFPVASALRLSRKGITKPSIRRIGVLVLLTEPSLCESHDATILEVLLKADIPLELIHFVSQGPAICHYRQWQGNPLEPLLLQPQPDPCSLPPLPVVLPHTLCRKNLILFLDSLMNAGNCNGISETCVELAQFSCSTTDVRKFD